MVAGEISGVTELGDHAAGRSGYSVRSSTPPPFRAGDEEIRP